MPYTTSTTFAHPAVAASPLVLPPPVDDVPSAPRAPLQEPLPSSVRHPSAICPLSVFDRRLFSVRHAEPLSSPKFDRERLSPVPYVSMLVPKLE